MYEIIKSPLLTRRTEGERTATVWFLLFSLLAIYVSSSFLYLAFQVGVMVIGFFAGLNERISELGGIVDQDVYAAEYARLIEDINNFMQSRFGVLSSLVSTAAVIALALLFCRFIERRDLSTLGLVRRRALRGYGAGLLVGLLLFSLAYLVMCLTDAVAYKGVTDGITFPILLLYFLGYVIQGASEEILFRGFFMLSLTRRKSVVFAVVMNSLVFAFFHLANGGLSFVAVLNIFLFGVFASVLTLRTGSLLPACAVHTVWNFAQGNLFGCTVSGIISGDSLLQSELTQGRELTNGGAFGPEGGIAVTIVLFLAVVLLMLLPGRKSEKE